MRTTLDLDADLFRQALQDAGFTIGQWKDETQASIDWFRAMFTRVQSEGPPPINVAVLLGEDFPAMAANASRSMEEGLIKVVMAVAVRQ